MGWKGECARVIQATPSQKVSLPSGGYCSLGLRVREGVPAASQFFAAVRKVFLLRSRIPVCNLKWKRERSNILCGLKTASDTVFMNTAHCCTWTWLPLSFSTTPLCAHWRGRGSTRLEARSSGLPGLLRISSGIDSFAQIPAAISTRLRLLAALFKSNF